MRFLHATSLLAAASAAYALPDQQQKPQQQAEIQRRALPNSPSGGYAPKVVDCPTQRPTVRSAGGLSPDESAWLVNRRKNTIEPMTDFLNRAGIKDFNAGDYISRFQNNVSALPNIALAFSGGGYRALMNGAGFIKAADDRTPGSTGKGGIGGLLQSATYISGLSGGGWLVGSIYNNNFSTVADLQSNPRVWKFDRSIFTGPSSSGNSVVKLFDSAGYWYDVAKEVAAKRAAGFDVSLTDYWGRALAYQLIDGDDGGDQYLFSSIAQTDDFKNANNPFPIIVADGRAPNTIIISLNSTVFEFNPFELGSWDPTTFGFAPLQYLASNFSGGVVPAKGKCVRGLDQSSFVMGTSSSLFNQLLLRFETGDVDAAIPEAIASVIKSLADKIDKENNDVASWKPNPFFGFHNNTAGSLATSEELSLVDGGSDLQNIPLQPLIQPARNVDVIYAIDSSADTVFNWPNGTAMIATYERSLSPMGNGTLFPAVPDHNTFLNSGLNNRPTFFGCDVRNFSLAAGARAPPLVVYIPNAPYTTSSNVSTFTLKYEQTQRDAIIANAFTGATQGNGTLDSEWPACVACAALHRSLLRTDTPIPAQCTACFTKYCWDGKTATAPRTSDTYQPPLKIGNQSVANEKKSDSGKLLGRQGYAAGGGVAAGAFAALAAIVAML